MGKIKQNELNCRDTAPLNQGSCFFRSKAFSLSILTSRLERPSIRL